MNEREHHEKKAIAYETEGRKMLADSKRIREKQGTNSLSNAYQCFTKAGEEFERAGNLKKAEANYRLADRIEHTIFEGDIDRPAINKPLAERLKKWRLEDVRLSRASATASIIGIIGGAILLFSNLSNSNVSLSPGMSQFNWKLWLGIILLAIGLVAGFFWLKGRKKK